MSRGSLHLTIIPALCRNLGKELNKPLAKTKPMYNIATLEGAATAIQTVPKYPSEMNIK